MKKIALLLIVCLLSSVMASAQLIVGGVLDFSASSQKNTSLTDGHESLKTYPSRLTLGIAPKVGYIINDTWEVGAKLGLRYNQTMDYVVLSDDAGENPKAFKNYKTSDIDWSIDPYARWRAVEFKGLGVWIEGLVSLGSRSTPKKRYYAAQYGSDGVIYRSKIEADAMNDTPVTEKTSTFIGGLYIQPVLTYAINEHFRLETTLNFLGLNLSGSVQKQTDSEGYWNINSTCNFGLNIDSEDVLSIGYLTIGFVYAF